MIYEQNAMPKAEQDTKNVTALTKGCIVLHGNWLIGNY